MTSRRTAHTSAFAVVRVDHHPGLGPLEDADPPVPHGGEHVFTVKEVVMSAEEAIREVARLNALCSDRTSTRYFWSGTHLFRDGGSFGSASYGYDAD